MSDTLRNDHQLKPCPFCGSPGQIPDWLEAMSKFYVTCTSVDCFATVGEGYDRDAMPDHVFPTPEEAAAAWNRRAA